tara:strand:- start:147 stop:422 length:276 start_codon:yes stop_codon:yes gene_type:complete
MNTNNRIKTIPNGEKIKGNNLLRRYVSKNMFYMYFNEIYYKYSRIMSISIDIISSPRTYESEKNSSFKKSGAALPLFFCSNLLSSSSTLSN